MIGRTIKSRLDLLKPSLADTVHHKQQKSKKHDYKLRSFEEGENVLARDYRTPSNKWVPGTVARRNGPVTYDIATSEGGLWKRHANQLLNSGPRMETPPNQLPDSDYEPCLDNDLDTHQESISVPDPDTSLHAPDSDQNTDRNEGTPPLSPVSQESTRAAEKRNQLPLFLPRAHLRESANRRRDMGFR